MFIYIIYIITKLYIFSTVFVIYTYYDIKATSYNLFLKNVFITCLTDLYIRHNSFLLLDEAIKC